LTHHSHVLKYADAENKSSEMAHTFVHAVAAVAENKSNVINKSMMILVESKKQVCPSDLKSDTAIHSKSPSSLPQQMPPLHDSSLQPQLLVHGEPGLPVQKQTSSPFNITSTQV
jgi:hypothetical protein